MGKIFSVLVKRPLRNFNIDNRAMKIIESEKAQPAPKHKGTVYKAVKHEESKEMQETLLERLKLVKVVSDNSSPVKEQGRTNEQLPQDRSYAEPPEYGFVEAESIPEGKASLHMVLEFLNRHQTDPKRWNAQLIAKEYKLDVALTEQVLKHFALYNVLLPEKGQQKTQFFDVEKWKKSILPEKTTTDKM